MSRLKKRCPRCSATKSTADFDRNARRHDGLASYCKPCKKAQRNESRLKDPDRYREKRRQQYLAHKEKERASNREWARKNPEKNAEYSKRWREADPGRARRVLRDYRKRHPDRIAASRFNRKVRFAHPITLIDPDGLKAPYRLAELMERLTGEPFHVDHIVPLNGKTVSGLHCPANLVPMPKADNLSKGSRFDSETEHSSIYYWRDIVLTLDKALRDGVLTLGK